MKIVDSLNYSMYLDDVEAHIITLPNNPKSVEFSLRCQESCRKIGQPFKVWEGFDGTSGQLIYPKHLENQDHFRFLKLMNDRLTITEIATIFSHYSLWAECVKIDKPIVILEHDSIMVKPYNSHDCWNQIVYLGNFQQYKEGRWASFPTHASATKNHRFICRAHAYVVDPPSARSLVSHLIKFGLSAPADMLIRADLFPIIQTDFHAFDLPGETTITGRNSDWEKDAKEIFQSFI
jgi:hypothetical protein